MKVIDLLKELENGEINESIYYVNGDFFYDLIVIDKNLYVINTMTKQLELLQSKYISKFIRDNVELLRLDNFEEILEEEKKIPEKLEDYYLDKKGKYPIELTMYEQILRNKINEIIDYLKSKGDE